MAEIDVLREIMPGACIHPDARIGRWCVIGPDVTIGPDVVLADRVTVIGHTTIGRGNRIDSCSVIGAEPQDLKYRGGATLVLIGDDNIIARNVTINAGTENGGWVTYVGHRNVIGEAAHVAHDCYIMDDTRLGAKVLLAGHVVIQNGARAGDMTGIHHFVRIGAYSLVGERTPVRRDVPPYTHYFSHDYYWDPPEVRGINESGVAEGCPDQTRQALLKQALEKLFMSKAALAAKLEAVAADRRLAAVPEVAELLEFCRLSNEGSFGRYRERFRGVEPPEAEQCLPQDILQRIRKEMES